MKSSWLVLKRFFFCFKTPKRMSKRDILKKQKEAIIVQVLPLRNEIIQAAVPTRVGKNWYSLRKIRKTSATTFSKNRQKIRRTRKFIGIHRNSVTVCPFFLYDDDRGIYNFSVAFFIVFRV